jgi:hypothetical protein
MAQLNPVLTGQAIQYQLANIVTPVPVYAAFNRNFATEPKFIVWHVRDIHQPVYTGSTQRIKGIDTPVFQVSVFTQKVEDGFTISNQILQSLHGYSGMFGNPANGGFNISKADVMWLYNGYDNEENMAQVFMDCTLYIPT